MEYLNLNNIAFDFVQFMRTNMICCALFNITEFIEFVA